MRLWRPGKNALILMEPAHDCLILSASRLAATMQAIDAADLNPTNNCSNFMDGGAGGKRDERKLTHREDMGQGTPLFVNY